MNISQSTTILEKGLRSLLVAVVACFGFHSMYAQQNPLTWQIHFETNSHALTPINKQLLDAITDSLKIYKTFDAYLNGHTDEVGSIEYNQLLSEKRIESVLQFFHANGLNKNNFRAQAYGETKPIANNYSKKGRQQNRRVTISIFPIKSETKNELTEVVNLLIEPINNFYKLLEKPATTFCINPTRDTILKCPEGTLLYVKANSFPIADKCKNNCLLLKIKEFYKYSDMLMENLTTTSDGRLLETYGMIKTEAMDCVGDPISMADDNGLVVFVPTDEHPSGLKIFAGTRDESDFINWKIDDIVPFEFSTSNFSAYLNSRASRMFRCPFFFCKIKRFLGFSKWHPRVLTATEIPDNTSKELMALQERFGIQDLNKLAEAMGLNDANYSAQSLVIQDKKQKISSGSASIEDYKYYVFNAPKLDWRNCDVFMDLKPNMMATMQVDLKPLKNVDCKLVFKKRQALVPAKAEDEFFSFVNIPKNEKAWLVALKYEEGTPFLSMREVIIGKKTIPPLKFKAVSIGELEKQLKKLDI